MPQAAQGTGVMGGDGWTGTLLSALTPTMVGLAWAKPPLTAPPWSTKLVPNPHVKGNQNTQTSVQGGTQGAWQCFRCQGWGHMAQEWHNTCNAFKQERGDPRECSQTPLKSCAQ